jgi:hypothetical protein
VKQDGDLEQMIWNVPEIIWKLSEMVALEAGDIIMTGTPAACLRAAARATSSSARSRAVGKVSVTIGPNSDPHLRQRSEPRRWPRILSMSPSSRRRFAAAQEEARGSHHRRHPAVDEQDVPVDERRCVAREENRRALKSSTLPQRPAGVRAQTQAENFSSAITRC